jgi:hypothetical protein
MDLTHDFLIGRWRLQSWVSKRIVHSPEEDRKVLHSIGGIPDEEVDEKIYKVWEEAQTSDVYEQAFLRSFKNEPEMADCEIEFIPGGVNDTWSQLRVRNGKSGEVIKEGAWMIEGHIPNAIDLSVWNYNIHLKVRIFSDRQILLKELLAYDEMESYTHEFTLERI